MDTKRLGLVEIKDEAKGEFSSIIATYGALDSDGDVTEPGAHKDGQRVVVSSYGHSAAKGQLPVGTATLQVQNNRTVAKGNYFMDIPEARDSFLTMKRLHEQGLGEWSYGYEVLDAEMGERDGRRVRFLKSLDVFEVSHVLRGAGVGTRTLTAKDAPNHPEPTMTEYKAAIRPHPGAVTAREWDGPAVLAAIGESATVSDLRSIFAGVDTHADPETKAAYLFPHHHGVGGPANVRACVAGIAAINRATNLPDEARKGMYEHLAGHLRDSDREPPGLQAPGGQAKNIDRLPALLDELAGLVEDIREVGSSRAAKGKQLSSLTFEVLGWAAEDLARLDLTVKSLLASPREAAATAYVRLLAQRHRQAS